MEKLLTYCLSIGLVALLAVSCQQRQPELYKKTFTAEEKKRYAEQLNNSIGYYYQGSVPWQFLLREAKSLDPTHPEIYRELGIPPLKRGMASLFYTPYDKAVELDPKGWQGWRGYIYLYFYRDYDRAIYDFDTLDPLTPNFVDYPQSQSIDFMRGIAYMMKEDYVRALEYFDKHFAYESEEVGVKYLENRAFLYKGICHLKMGDTKEALAILNQGLTYNNTNPDLHYWKAKTLVQQGAPQAEIAQEVAAAKQYFGNRNIRAYTEQFYQLYWSDLEELEALKG